MNAPQLNRKYDGFVARLLSPVEGEVIGVAPEREADDELRAKLEAIKAQFSLFFVVKFFRAAAAEVTTGRRFLGFNRFAVLYLRWALVGGVVKFRFWFINNP